MRLLNVNSLSLENFPGEVPLYAILSHTWGENEVTLEDVKDIRSKRDFLSAMTREKNSTIGGHGGKAYDKVYQTATFAQEKGFSYVWIDSCCIDKSSSAELSEAINSMFAWYQQAEICYAYLADLSRDPNLTIGVSRWFTRGWTLQELIAPKEVVFLNKEWRPVGTRKTLRSEIVAVTQIDVDVLDGSSLEEVSAAARMSWVSRRQTTRPEDIAYCLLGLLGVNMPLLYGEGKEKAFIRLQEEFLKVSDDESLFAWCATPEDAKKRAYWGLLSPTPEYFAKSHLYKKSNILTLREGHPTLATNRGLRVELLLSPLRGDKSETIFLAVLHCNPVIAPKGQSAVIILQRLSGHESQYARVAADVLMHLVSRGDLTMLPWDGPSQSFYRLATDVLGFEKLDEPKMEYLSVRQSPRKSGLVIGFHVNEIWDVRHDEFRVCITEFRDKYGARVRRRNAGCFSIDLDEEYDRSKLASFEPGNLKERVELGRMEVKVERYNPYSRRLVWENSIDLAVGLEPLPENPLGTSAGFTRPWCADLPDGPDGKISLPTSAIPLSTGFDLEVKFTLTTRWAKAFYKMEFEILEKVWTPRNVITKGEQREQRAPVYYQDKDKGILKDAHLPCT